MTIRGVGELAQNPHLPTAMRSASSPVKLALTRAKSATSPATQRERRIAGCVERDIQLGRGKFLIRLEHYDRRRCHAFAAA